MKRDDPTESTSQAHTAAASGSRAAKAKPARRGKVSTLSDDPLWYKDAIIYQVHIKSFFDANNDGVGDFPGLIAKLDYIAELGVNAIWLLPFYPSPRRPRFRRSVGSCARMGLRRALGWIVTLHVAPSVKVGLPASSA